MLLGGELSSIRSEKFTPQTSRVVHFAITTLRYVGVAHLLGHSCAVLEHLKIYVLELIIMKKGAEVLYIC